MDALLGSPPDAGDDLPTKHPDEPPFATLVANDGTLIKLRLTKFGELVLQVGNREPRTLDRFQVAALRVAMLATGER